MIDRRLLLIGGFALFGLAVFELAAPGSLPIPVTDGILVLFSVGVLGYAYLVVQKRRSRGLNLSETPDVELPQLTAVPGDRLDAVLETFPGVDGVERTSLSSIRTGLRRAAVTVLTRYAGYSEPVARDRVADGSWTTDRAAGDFLRESGSGSVSDQPTDRTERERLIDRATEAIVTVSNVAQSADEDDSGTAPTGSPPRIPDDVEQTAIAPDESHEDAGMVPGDRRETNHWVGIGFVVLVCLGVGTLTRNPGILLGSIVGIGYAAYARSTPVGTVDLAIERSVSQTEPQPGETVEVTLTVRNEGRLPLPDLRIVDGVPEALAVSEGSPRCGTVLRGGDSVTLSYTITARRGTHEFGPALALVRNLPGSVEQDLYLTDPTTITCRPTVQPLQEPIPLRNQATPYTGQVETDDGGTGVEFQSVREYHPGDSLTRIDWNRRARTGELTTVEFREERAATVVILVDCRRSAYVGPTETAAVGDLPTSDREKPPQLPSSRSSPARNGASLDCSRMAIRSGSRRSASLIAGLNRELAVATATRGPGCSIQFPSARAIEIPMPGRHHSGVTNSAVGSRSPHRFSPLHRCPSPGHCSISSSSRPTATVSPSSVPIRRPSGPPPSDWRDSGGQSP